MVLILKNLRKTYADGTQALKGVDLSIQEGDFYALLGANGAGKTTIIGILTDLVRKTAGDVQVFGMNLDTDLEAIKRMIGVVPQEFNFNIFQKVQKIIVHQAGFFGIPRDIALQRSEKILKKLQLWEKRNTIAKSLSGGMKRRLMIARALIHQPRFLILDEPTAGVDVELRRSMWEYLRELNANGVTVLLTTHYLEEVEAMCNRMAMVKDGVVVREGHVAEILQGQDKRHYTVVTEPYETAPLRAHLDLRPIDATSLSFVLPAGESIGAALMEIEEAGIVVLDIRPYANRIESFFLDTLQQS